MPHSRSWKKCITRTNPVLTSQMSYCSYRDVTSVYSLNSRQAVSPTAWEWG